MKKWYKIILFLSLLSGILANSKRIFASEYNPDWVSYREHHYTTTENPYISYQLTGSGTPWYTIKLDDSSKGIIIKYNRENRAPIFYYLCKVNTASLWETNNIANSDTSMSLATLSATGNIIDNDFRTLFPNLGTLYYSSISRDPILYNCDFEVTSSQDLYNQLEELNFTYPGNALAGDLPLLSYNVTRKTVPQASLNVFTTKIILGWDYTEKEPYKSTPTEYTFDIMASCNFTQAQTGIGEIWDANNTSVNDNCKIWITNGGDNISINSYSFLYDDVGKKLYSLVGKTWNNDSINAPSLGYYIYVRTRNNVGSKVSYWKVFKIWSGELVSTNLVMKPDGTFVSADDFANGDDGITTGNSGTAPYDPDGSSSAQGDTSSDLYDGESTFNITTMIASLKSIVNSIKELPTIFATLVTFMPSWLISLLVLSIGMLVVIGVVKVITR